MCDRRRAPNRREDLADEIARRVKDGQSNGEIIDALGVNHTMITGVKSRRGLQCVEQTDAERDLDPTI